MVSKVTLIALVLIVSTPILLGYAMAFDEVTDYRWEQGASKNVTDMLYNSKAFTNTSLDSYSLNSMVLTNSSDPQQTYPDYQSITANKTAVPYTEYHDTTTVSYEPSQLAFFEIVPTGSPISVVLYYPDLSTTSLSVLSLSSVADNASTGTVFGYDQNNNQYSYSGVATINFPNGVDSRLSYRQDLPSYYQQFFTYANLVDGWNLPVSIRSTPYSYVPDSHNSVGFNEIIMSINLASFVGTLYYDIEYDDETITLTIQSTTDGTSHTLIAQVGSDAQQLYMNLDPGFIPSATDNWYQLRVTTSGLSFSYIHNIDSSFGPHKSFSEASWTFATKKADYTLQSIELPLNTSIVYRGEFALCKGFDYPVIEDNSFTAKPFSGDSNEITISQISGNGPSFSFAGETVTITNGSFTLDGKKFSIDKGITLRSTFEDLQYTNYINGVEVSTTAAAPSVTFNGAWDCAVESTVLTHEQYTSTEWTPGKFAWNGVDQSFALMGLITCAAVFVGLGMYGARSGAKVGKLMIICGAAAFVFLAIM